ncbi:GMC oxidoreductase [Variovorax paradoxus]
MMDPSSHAYALSWQSLPRVLASPFQYLLDRSGMLANNAAEGGGLVRTRPELDRPDVQVTLLAGLKETARAIPREHGIMLLVTLLRPRSRGSVTLASSTPADRPLIHPAFLEHREDVQTLVAGVRETRRILSMAPIADHLGIERMPGRELRSDEELAQAIRRTLFTVHHPVGTCKMGPSSDAEAVVDARLRVHGVNRLRVADASVMPTIIAGNTSAPAMMIGERAASFILGREPVAQGRVAMPETAVA